MLTSKFVFVSSLALAATGALADSGDLHINDWSNFDGSVTREQVLQEMQDAYARGDRDMGERGYVLAQDSSPSRGSAEVQAELHTAQRFGLVSIGESDAPIATAEQEAVIAKAGHDAVPQVADASAVEEQG